MEYRGKRFSIVQGLDPHSWKWRVELDEKTVKSGESPMRAAAVVSAMRAVDKAMAKKSKVRQPKVPDGL